MSMNAALNATVAYLEGRTDLAKELLRGPASDVKSVPAILVRLDRAVDNAAAYSLRQVLKRTLAIEPDKTRLAQITKEEAFFEGVSRIETILEHYLMNLEWTGEDR